MTLAELYANIGGDYQQALRVLRMDRLLDKHIRRLPANGVFDQLIEAGKTMDATQLFESAHAAKGICGNLGLTGLAAEASDIAEEFRPGNERKLSDGEVRQRINHIAELYKVTVDGINAYAAQ